MEIARSADIWMGKKSVCRLGRNGMGCLKQPDDGRLQAGRSIGLAYYKTSVSCMMSVILNVIC